jgi:hypothetical protein
MPSLASLRKHIMNTDTDDQIQSACGLLYVSFVYAKRSVRILRTSVPTWECFEIHTVRLLGAVSDWGIFIKEAVSYKARVVLKVKGTGLLMLQTNRSSNCGACLHQQACRAS